MKLKLLSILLLITLLTGCAVPVIVANITNEVLDGKREQKKLEAEKLAAKQRCGDNEECSF